MRALLPALLAVNFTACVNLQEGGPPPKEKAPKAQVAGRKGRVHARLADRGDGGGLRGVLLVFTHENGTDRYKTKTGFGGKYRIELPDGRYRVTASHPGYERHNKGEFHVVHYQQMETLDFHMLVKGGYVCPRDSRFASEAPPEFVVNPADTPPSVRIAVAPKIVKLGQRFDVIITAKDREGMAGAWWRGEGSTDPYLVRGNGIKCHGEKRCSGQWKFKAKHVGTHVLWADARDTAYPRPNEPHQSSTGVGMGCATLTITE